jgi:putative toxin-antitoxin system antitoxin component (TIGR02293 family)
VLTAVTSSPLIYPRRFDAKGYTEADMERMVNEITSIAEALGGETALGRPVHTIEEMKAVIREGYPHAVVQAFVAASGLTLEEVASSLDLSARNLRRPKHEGRLATYESDRLYRLARIVALAEHFIGSHKNAIGWLKRPNLVLGSIPPLRLLDTELGVLQVENVLGRIGYGGVG